jgi:hypothetical protein
VSFQPGQREGARGAPAAGAAAVSSPELHLAWSWWSRAKDWRARCRHSRRRALQGKHESSCVTTTVAVVRQSDLSGLPGIPRPACQYVHTLSLMTRMRSRPRWALSQARMKHDHRVLLSQVHAGDERARRDQPSPAFQPDRATVQTTSLPHPEPLLLGVGQPRILEGTMTTVTLAPNEGGGNTGGDRARPLSAICWSAGQACPQVLDNLSSHPRSHRPAAAERSLTWDFDRWSPPRGLKALWCLSRGPHSPPLLPSPTPGLIPAHLPTWDRFLQLARGGHRRRHPLRSRRLDATAAAHQPHVQPCPFSVLLVASRTDPWNDGFRYQGGSKR